MNVIQRCDAIEDALTRRIAKNYTSALVTALRKKKRFLQTLKDVDSGKIKPPQQYVDTDTVDKWRQGFIRELIRQENVIDGIMDELNKAGIDASQLIRDTMPEYYALNHTEAVEALSGALQANGMDGTLTDFTRRQVEIIVQNSETAFTRLAHENLRTHPAVRRRLENELIQATILGESQAKLVKRIQNVTGQAAWQAKRVAQTERTRVQSQARWEVGNQAMALGVAVVNEWSTRMVNSRETHIELDGKVALQGEYFPGSPLRYPGDPFAPAAEVINCHCVLYPDVLSDGQMVIDGRVVG